MESSRRQILSLLSLSIGGLAGCSLFEDESRVIGLAVINNTEQYHEVDVTLYKEGELFASQTVEIAGKEPNHSHGIETIMVDEVPRGTEFSVEAALDGGEPQTSSFTVECGDDWRGDGVTIRIRDTDYLYLSTGCVSKIN
jgi:hypothetical protein